MAKKASKKSAGVGGAGGAGSKKSPVVAFASLQVARSRSGGAGGSGGRYNPKTRRLVVPASFAGKKVAVVSGAGGLLLVGGSGGFACHPTQHFITLPAGVVSAVSAVDLAVASPEDVAGAFAELGCERPEDVVGYRLPAAPSGGAGAKKSPKKSGGAGAKKSLKKS